MCMIYSFFLFLLPSILSFYVSFSAGSQPIMRMITVAHKGRGDFNTVQAAINSVPDGNSQWIKIHIKQGNYMEKVTIPLQKGHVILQGEGSHKTFIQWGDHAPLISSSNRERLTEYSWDTATFLSLPDSVILSNITFKNTFHDPFNPHNAVAALINGDKTSIYGCSFIGIQDTLSDLSGRHYFKDCYVEGIVDFIFGYGQSIYEECQLNTVPSNEPVGYMTAQGRQRASDTDGFVFKNCWLTGSAKAYLGRGWSSYARVLYYQTFMEDVVVPEGWLAWEAANGGEETVFAESGCTGIGANLQGRVNWEKTLTASDVQKLTSVANFINYDSWLDQQPDGYGYTPS